MGQLMSKPVTRFVILPGLLVVMGLAVFLMFRWQARALPGFNFQTDAQVSASAFTKTIEGYSQIVVKVDGKETVITDDRFNNLDVFARGNYVVWIRELAEEHQVIRYQVSSGIDTVLATGGVFERPRVDRQGNVVWQWWDKTADTWRIAYFDGQTHNLAHFGLYPDISGDRILFVKKNQRETWDLVELDLKSKLETVLATNPAVKQAWFDDEYAYFPGARVPLDPSPTPVVPDPTLPPPFIDTAINPPDVVEGEPSQVPPGDQRIFENQFSDLKELESAN